MLLGADPLADFPDSTAAVKGLEGARFVVAVDTHLTDSSRPGRRGAACGRSGPSGAARSPTSRAASPGSARSSPTAGVAWPDWMIGGELASRLGVDLGFSDLEDIWAEVSRVSPLHLGIELSTITGLQGRDGVVVPVERRAGRRSLLRVRGRASRGGRSRLCLDRLDPMADPGIASAELHTVPPPTALAVDRRSAAPATSPRHATRPGCPRVAPGDGARRPGTAGQSRERSLRSPCAWSPAAPCGTAATGPGVSSPRAPRTPTRCSGSTPTVLADLGAADGETVTRPLERGSPRLPGVGRRPGADGHRGDPDWNLPGVRAGDLIDASADLHRVTVKASEGS